MTSMTGDVSIAQLALQESSVTMPMPVQPASGGIAVSSVFTRVLHDVESA